MDGVKIKGMHNYDPSRAVDIIPVIEVGRGKKGGRWEASNGCVMVGVVMSAFEIVMKYHGKWEGTGQWTLRSGADWNGNKTYVTDQTFDDIWHFELRWRK